MVSIATAIVELISAIAAMISAGIAYRVKSDLASTDRERRLRKVSLLANKLDAVATDVDELGEYPLTRYDSSFSMSGRTGSGHHNP